MVRRPSAFAALVSILSAAVASACSDVPTAPVHPITELPRALSSTEQLLIASSNDFAVDLLRTVHLAQPDSTVFLSPLSASIALGMTANGAAGETQKQITDMLGFGGLDMADVNASYRELVALLTDLDPLVRLDIGNAIFHRRSFILEEAFLDDVRNYFDAEVAGLDFDDPGAVDVVNGWASQATQGRIPKVIDGIDPSTMAFLMNAIYFKGEWTKSFDRSDSYNGPFLLQGGGTAEVRFMMKEDTLGYRSSSEWQAVDIPYGAGPWAMTIVVPRDGFDLVDVVDDLGTLLDPGADWNEAPLAIHLPRFELEWQRVLNDELKALGMIDAFSEVRADLTPMYANALQAGLYVQFVKQNTFLKIDEVGTEAAAVTVVGVGIVCGGCGGPAVVRADRPFLIAIRERLSGTVLFAGFVVEPPSS